MAFRRPLSRFADPQSPGQAAPSASVGAGVAQPVPPANTSVAAMRDLPNDERGFLTEVFRCHALAANLAERLLGFAMAPTHAPRPVDRLAIALAAHFNFLPLDDVLRMPVLLYGLPGAGISTLAAKLAARFDERQVLVIAADVRDAGKTARLEECLEVLDLPLAVAPDAAALRKLVSSADGRMVIVDGGTGTLSDPAFAKRIHDAIDAARAEGVLALPADAGSDEAAAEATAAGRLGTHRLMVTKLDITRYLGSALAAADLGKLALVAASITPHYGFGLRNFSPENLARRLAAAAMRAERWRAAPL